jgi:hypothetical protein
MGAQNYRQYARRVATVLTGKWAARYLHAIKLVQDGLLQGAVEAVKTRFLHVAPDDALPRAGNDSSLPRYPTEVPSQHRARLLRRFDDWPFAGTVQGIEAQLHAFGLTGAAVEELVDFNWDGDTANWSRFWITIPPPHPWHDDGLWVEADVDEPSTWDDDPTAVWDSSDMTTEDVAALRGIPARFKPAHVICDQIILIFDLALWNADLPDGTWGNVLNWNPNALYIAAWEG